MASGAWPCEWFLYVGYAFGIYAWHHQVVYTHPPSVSSCQQVVLFLALRLHEQPMTSFYRECDR